MGKLTQETLKSLLHYNPDTGRFTWLAKTSSRSRVEIGGVAGCVDTIHGYRRIMINGKSYLAHRLAWFYMTGSWPESEIDHKNHLRHENQWDNLREVTHKKNQQNQSLYSTNTSGCAGVSWEKDRKKWRALIWIDGKLKNLGRFTDKKEAEAARARADIKYGFHPNHGVAG